MKPKRVYLDVCVLGRLFDDQRQVRIRLETDAMELILAHVRKSAIELVVSPAHTYEIRANPKAEQREYLLELLNKLGSEPEYDPPSIRARAEFLIDSGMGIADATHVAFAEFADAEFITVDDRLLKLCQRLGINSWFGTPLVYCDKEGLR